MSEAFETQYGTGETCPENDGKPHEAGTDFHLEPDGEAFYVDVSCRHCGRGGCIGRFKAEEVQW